MGNSPCGKDGTLIFGGMGNKENWRKALPGPGFEPRTLDCVVQWLTQSANLGVGRTPANQPSAGSTEENKALNWTINDPRRESQISQAFSTMLPKREYFYKYVHRRTFKARTVSTRTISAL